MQFDTINQNRWHTAPNTGRINAKATLVRVCHLE